MTIQVLSPTGGQPLEDTFDVAARLVSLPGAKLGLLDNSKTNAGALLDAVSGRLLGDYPTLDVRLWQKGEGTGAAGAAPTEMLAEMSREVEAVLVALGD